MSHYARHSCISLVLLRAYRKNVFFLSSEEETGKHYFVSVAWACNLSVGPIASQKQNAAATIACHQSS